MISLIKKKKQARNEKPGAGFQSFPAPVLYIAWPRFRYYGHGLFLLQENNVQDDTDQHAGKHPSDRAGEHQQNGRDAGEAQDNGHRTQQLPGAAGRRSFSGEVSLCLFPDMSAAIRAAIFDHVSVHSEKEQCPHLSLPVAGWDFFGVAASIPMPRYIQSTNHFCQIIHIRHFGFHFAAPLLCYISFCFFFLAFLSGGLSGRHIEIRSRTGGWHHPPEIFQPPRRPQNTDKGAKGTCTWAYSYVSISVHAARGGLRS